MMSEQQPRNLKDELALAVAKGISITVWAKKRNVPKTTAYRWASEPDVVKAAQAHRRRSVDRAVGRMTDRYVWATDRIARLAAEAESESVQLSALRSILSDMIAVSNHSGLEERMTNIEKQLDERDSGASETSWTAADRDSGSTAYANGHAAAGAEGAS
jgi:hypothetical protein